MARPSISCRSASANGHSERVVGHLATKTPALFVQPPPPPGGSVRVAGYSAIMSCSATFYALAIMDPFTVKCCSTIQVGARFGHSIEEGEGAVMRFTSTILIRRNADEVRGFLTDPSNLPKWDRGVAAVEVPGQTNVSGVGFEFTTVGYPGSGADKGRMTYRVTATDRDGMDCRTELTSRNGNARFFRSAEWRQVIEDAPEGSRVTFSTQFRLHFRYFLMAPVLCLFGKSALHKDLVHLRTVLESGSLGINTDRSIRW